MTKKEIIKGNKLIAKFMGINILTSYGDKKGPYGYAQKYTLNFNDEYYDSTLHFEESWDWLMPVINKIENISRKGYTYDFPKVKFLGDHVEIFWYSTYRGTIIYWRDYHTISGNFSSHPNQEKTKLLTTYKAIIEFINWYNKNL